MIKLYNYFRSSASFRARIALHWKQLKFEYIAVHLTKEGGQQHSPQFRKLNPMGHVPVLSHNGHLIFETMAILQYLDDIFPSPSLFPSYPADKATVVQLCEMVNSGIQPLQNLKLQKFLETQHGLSKPESNKFVRHWIDDGMGHLETLLSKTAGEFSFGDQLTAADCFIVPQIATAQRFGVEISNYRNLNRINDNALKVQAVQNALPKNQPDFQA